MNAASRFTKKPGGSFDFPGPYPYNGFVTDRRDPEGLGRVRVRIPGALDGTEGTQARQSGWLYPLGQSRSGSAGSGGPMVPAQGAAVVVFFMAGQIENGIYFTGPWSRGMVPEGNAITDDGDATVWETDRLRARIDSTGGTTSIRLEDKATGESSSMTLDMKTLQTAMHGATGAANTSRGAVVNNGLSVSSNGRPVLPTVEFPRTALPTDHQVPLPAPVVPVIPPPPARLSLTLPGGLVMTAIPQLQDGILTSISSVQNLMTQAGPALAAMQPVLILIDAVVAIFDVLNAVPMIIVLPDGPGDFAQALRDAAEKISKVAGLVPQVSVPLMVRDMIALITQTLTELVAMLELAKSLDEQAEAVIAEATAAGNAPLIVIGEGVKAQAEQMAAHAGASIGPVADLMKMVTALLDFLPGAPDLPDLGDLSGGTIDEVIDILNTIIAVLEGLGF